MWQRFYITLLINEGTGKLLQLVQIRIWLTEIYFYSLQGGEFILRCHEQESFVQLGTENGMTISERLSL